MTDYMDFEEPGRAMKRPNSSSSGMKNKAKVNRLKNAIALSNDDFNIYQRPRYVNRSY